MSCIFFFLTPQKYRFQEWGLEKGWGDTAEHVKETVNYLSEVLQAPDPANLEKFFSRVPSIFNIVIFSPHGYFGQENVLGLPDTGGQVQKDEVSNFNSKEIILTS
jgi:sucrose synthase